MLLVQRNDAVIIAQRSGFLIPVSAQIHRLVFMGGKIREIEKENLASQRSRKQNRGHAPFLAYPECRGSSRHPQRQAEDRQQAESGKIHAQTGTLIHAKRENPDRGKSSQRSSGVPAAERVPIQTGGQQRRACAEQRREQNSQNQHRNPLPTNLMHPVYHNRTGMKRKKSHSLQNVTFWR